MADFGRACVVDIGRHVGKITVHERDCSTCQRLPCDDVFLNEAATRIDKDFPHMQTAAKVGGKNDVILPTFPLRTLLRAVTDSARLASREGRPHLHPPPP